MDLLPATANCEVEFDFLPIPAPGAVVVAVVVAAAVDVALTAAELADTPPMVTPLCCLSSFIFR